MSFNREMQAALQADAEKLSQLTGEEHTVEFLEEENCPKNDAQPHEFERFGDDLIACVFCGIDRRDVPW